MLDVLTALKGALISLFHPRMLLLMVWPMAVALLLWGGLAVVYWGDWAAFLSQWLAHSDAGPYLNGGASWVAGSAIFLLILLALLPLAYATALLLLSLFAMPAMVSHVASRAFPDLEQKHGGSNLGSAWNGLVATTIFLGVWMLTLPLWLVSLLAPVVPVLLGAYLNQRLFRYDALAEHASREEFESVTERAAGRLYLLGAILALVQFVPVLNFFSPVYVGLAFIHLCLAELAKLRREAQP
jgi:Protein of unknown function (DUF540).